jgi:hypothetical protein
MIVKTSERNYVMGRVIIARLVKVKGKFVYVLN